MMRGGQVRDGQVAVRDRGGEKGEESGRWGGGRGRARERVLGARVEIQGGIVSSRRGLVVRLLLKDDAFAQPRLVKRLTHPPPPRIHLHPRLSSREL